MGERKPRNRKELGVACPSAGANPLRGKASSRTRTITNEAPLQLGAGRSEKKSGAESDSHQSDDTDHSDQKSRCAPRNPRVVGTLAKYESPGSDPQKNRGERMELGEKASTQKQAAKDEHINQRQDRSNGCVKEKG